MAVNYYRYDDDDAPVLSGTDGALIALFDACLIDGYSSGATEKLPAGWSHPIATVGNIATYQHDSGEAIYRVCDKTSEETIGTAPSTARCATIRGFMSMSDINTGTNMFPTTTQASYQGMQKSDTLSTASRKWVLVEENGLVYFAVQCHSGGLLYGGTYAFGKFKTFKPLDGYNYMLGASDNLSTTYSTWSEWCPTNLNLYMARAMNGITESQKAYAQAQRWDGTTAGRGYLGTDSMSGKINLSDHVILETDPSSSNYEMVRGIMVGIFYPYEDIGTNFDPMDTFSSSDSTINYVFTQSHTTSTNLAFPVIQTNLTWDW